MNIAALQLKAHRRGTRSLTKLDDKIWIIDTMALGSPGVVAAYVVRGNENALIDMGYASSAETVRKDIEESGLRAEDVDYLLPTHVHLDHSGSCGDLASAFNAALIRVHPKGERHLVDPTRLWEAAGQLFGQELMKQYGRPKPIKANRVKAIGDNEEISLGDGLTLRSIWTPGHASHHLSYVIEGNGTVFTGDSVGISSVAFPVLIPTTPPTSFNLEAAVESLRRIGRFSPKRLMTPHYGVVENACDSINENIHWLGFWTTKIREMLRGGLSIDAMVKVLSGEIVTRASNPNEPLPDHLERSIALSVSGIVGYLKYSDDAVFK
jgi:glyoxylase-like metal-dependent hydrolase (beta-lactamase superfamily II)